MHHRWMEDLALTVGDDIQVRVVESEQISPPTNTYPAGAETDRQKNA